MSRFQTYRSRPGLVGSLGGGIANHRDRLVGHTREYRSPSGLLSRLRVAFSDSGKGRTGSAGIYFRRGAYWFEWTEAPTCLYQGQFPRGAPSFAPIAERFIQCRIRGVPRVRATSQNVWSASKPWTSGIQPMPRSTSSFTGPKMPNDVPAISARNPSFMDLTEMARISAHT